MIGLNDVFGGGVTIAPMDVFKRILVRAVELGASEVHLDRVIRFRIAGQLVVQPANTVITSETLIRCAKLYGGLCIVKLPPQEATCIQCISSKHYTLRIRSTPNPGGERVVIHFLEYEA